MGRATFISPNAYLTLSLECGIAQFIKHYFTTSDPRMIDELRKYANTHIHSYTVAETGSIELDELIRLYDEAEAAAITAAEEREKKRLDEEKKKQEEHDYYSMLRAAYHAYL